MESGGAGVEAGLRRYFPGFILIVFILSGVDAFVGVNIKYPAAEADAGLLPKPEHVVDLLNILQIQQIKLQNDAHPSLLQALSGSDIQTLLTVTSESIRTQELASEWLDSNVLRFAPKVRITGIVVVTKESLLEAIEAMKKLHSSLVTSGLEKQIKVTSSIYGSELITTRESSGPSSSEFKHDYLKPMQELLAFLEATGSYLMIDMAPFEAHLRNEHSLESAISSAPESFLESSLDSAYHSIAKLSSKFSSVPVIIGSIGWPWSSGESPAASPENAGVFIRNLVKRCTGSSGGTPSKPEFPINVYLHELFDDITPGSSGSSGSRFGLFSITDQLPMFWFDLSHSGDSEVESEEDATLVRRMLADNGTSNGTSPGTGTGTGTPTGSGQYCVAKTGASDNSLSVGLNWACGQGNVDCTPIQQNGACYLPDSYASHASYAFNSYYQKNAGAGATCDFQGAAMLTSTDPSYSNCIYTSSGSSTGGGTSTGGAGSPTPSSSSNGINQPFNPSGPSSGATSLSVGGVVVVAFFSFFWWSVRF